MSATFCGVSVTESSPTVETVFLFFDLVDFGVGCELGVAAGVTPCVTACTGATSLPEASDSERGASCFEVDFFAAAVVEETTGTCRFCVGIGMSVD